MSTTPPSAHPTLARLFHAGSITLTVVQGLVVCAALLTLGYLLVPNFRAAAARRPAPLPPSMEAVDWHDPASGQYCLACHKQVGLAIGGLEVERGHSQNVPLNDTQRQAITEMGTVAGPDETLTCMSCHQLGRGTDNPFMLAETTADSQLCQHCHPGHYARGTPHDLRLSAPDEQNRIGQTVAEGGPCSACHLSHSFARELERSPLDPEGYCLPCHSAYGPAARHARTTMDHPESRCRECHDPHDMSNGAFLARPVAELCVSCHTGYGDGLAGGSHPLGAMDKPVPAELVAAGAHLMDQPQQLTCIVCHDTHKAEHEKLLHVTPEANRLCLACHEDKLLEAAGAEVLPRHGQQPILNAEQRAVVEHWGNPVGPDGQMLCISCHGVHDAVPDTQLLSFRPKYGETCSACHPAQESVVGSPHDLRIAFPNLPNLAGLTPMQNGVCSPCHMAHQFPRERVTTPGDPGGQCIACHQTGECGQTKLTGGVDHPGTTCLDCHDPHVRDNPHFLIAPPEQLCLRCHADQAALHDGPHDLRKNPEVWPAEARATGDPCLSCHVPHGGERADLFRFRTSTGLGNHDGVCITCHPNDAWDATSDTAAIHPRQISPEQKRVPLALVPTDVHGEKRLGCRTCHDPHGGAQPVHLARVTPEEPTEELCLHCHDNKRLMRHTGHSAESMAAAGYTIDSCKPCHAMHAKPADTYGNLLSPRFLMALCDLPEDQSSKCVPCLACHRADGGAPERTFSQHPDVIIQNVFQPTDAGYMPLFDANGHVDDQGQITCRTCHLSHGRLDLLENYKDRAALPPEERHALMAQLRRFNTPNICTTCHGDRARALFLFFHEPARHPPAAPGQ